MTVSAFDLFSIGIGPSSSHTVGPMRAANRFVSTLLEQQLLPTIKTIAVEVFGSLAWTGDGHGTKAALLMGLEGERPESIDPSTVETRCTQILNSQEINCAGRQRMPFPPEHCLFNKEDLLPYHSNGMRFKAFAENGAVLLEAIYYSVGGGFVVSEQEINAPSLDISNAAIPYPFTSGDELLLMCKKSGLSISQMMMGNESVTRSPEAVVQGLVRIATVMQDCVRAGCMHRGMLPGKLKVKRRAAAIFDKLTARATDATAMAAAEDMNWLSVYAIAVNEENAAGGRVVTAPTNGAAGIIPAVLYFLLERVAPKTETAKNQLITDYLLTAAAIGSLYKENASISAAEVGCQGEVGVACSMAAAGFAAVMGGTVEQIENAAEIGMEHHLGLTCDPIAGLVQIPCIERNAMGAVQAVNAARLALLEDGSHHVSLDEVIETMRQTGKDMSTKYKETAQGGLAVNVPDC